MLDLAGSEPRSAGGGGRRSPVVGWFVQIANGIWFIHRIVKGCLRLNDNQPMYSA